MYCLKCKQNTEDKDAQESTSANGKKMCKALCASCGSKKCKFLPMEKKATPLPEGGSFALPKGRGMKPRKGDVEVLGADYLIAPNKSRAQQWSSDTNNRPWGGN